MQKINLLGYRLEQLIELFQQMGLQKLDAKRVYPWIHVKRVKDFDVMSDVPLSVRDFCKEHFSLDRGKCVHRQISRDGTQKALLEMADGEKIETVLIPDDDRMTVCVSSQIGCAMGCKFCHTGTQSLVRNLSASEIVGQILFWQDQCDITNIVFMGMGEPLMNFESVESALIILLSPQAHNYSRHRITISTSGIVNDSFLKLAELGVPLAISLHAPNDQKRNALMPINFRYPLKILLEAAKEYRRISNTKHITFEYLLLKDVNDSREDAIQLVRLLHGLACKVNLIRYNDWPMSRFARTSEDRVNAFAFELKKRGIMATVRQSKGDDIFAACGQLKTQIIS